MSKVEPTGTYEDCEKCNGKGLEIKGSLCKDCHGSGCKLVEG